MLVRSRFARAASAPQPPIADSAGWLLPRLQLPRKRLGPSSAYVLVVPMVHVA